MSNFVFGNDGLDVLVGTNLIEWGGQVKTFLKGKTRENSVAFATSGSSGNPPKAIVFTQDALLEAAHGAVKHLDMEQGDWCCALPTWHVGGAMVHLRAKLTGAKVFTLQGKWNASALRELVEQESISWTSLVPAQVVDLVNADLRAPQSLQAVIVGGAQLEQGMGERARALGWPVVQSYGATEAASQIATALPHDPFRVGDLPLLPHINAVIREDGHLALKGSHLFYAVVSTDANGKFIYEEREETQEWVSQDIVHLKHNKLTFLRRADRLVKILGELVDLDAIESGIRNHCPRAVIMTKEESRKGVELIACHPNAEVLQKACDIWNSTAPGIMRISKLYIIEIPHNEMGKIDRRKLDFFIKNYLTE